jgi:hypothetical protein
VFCLCSPLLLADLDLVMVPVLGVFKGVEFTDMCVCVCVCVCVLLCFKVSAKF